MNKNLIPSIVLGVVILAVGVWFAYDHFTSQNPPPVEDETTEPTKAVLNELYLATDPSEWFSVGDSVNWNDQLLVEVESVSVSKTLPDDVNDMTELYIYGFDHYQQLVDEDESKIFLDITINVTCIGLPSGSLFGLTLENCIVPSGSGQMLITYYHRETGQLIESTYVSEEMVEADITGGESVAVQDLSGNSDINVGAGYYELEVGETARFRMLEIISEEMWNSTDVLLTPCGGYSAEQLQWLKWEQPHILLNVSSKNASF